MVMGDLNLALKRIEAQALKTTPLRWDKDCTPTVEG